ncbi:MAG: molybdopterin molybdochelatase, partial [Nocardioidaceae bacterium]|nr:molybdopterin molybdochelatase [Nocardioidaceae bacterium]
MAVPEFLSVDEHLALILDRIHELPAYDQPLLETLGLPVVADVISPMALPSFDNSAMDGYALRAIDTRDATPDVPAHLQVVGDIAAGASSRSGMGPGLAMRIMTGAPIPAGADAVIPLED